MFVYCILRLWRAAVTVLWSSHSPYPGTAPGGSGAGPGGADDPASLIVEFALNKELLPDADAEGWSEVKRAGA